mmetsp:Transcript_4598/g.10085  ORF Transcript_4598/g.10085 Transcript_4598/m.10085 type:complete len:231 (+) Transcript_4598:27-719(+)|eukprot:CAMPEP_0204462452 /NCGR_PEP_ID=MMETSP0471-20130131/6187_1 /ASSEMBLY_ACC=CAM_ASM_000602 /TAXON_ID=2969 /ORGANISM="Oxyrrhis marina" /LENGTH=230 /DNA_ID=CAMNT_0051463621 /DNA_START=21 /DNA_END=713 /DNA_ORIENTATION=-
MGGRATRRRARLKSLQMDGPKKKGKSKYKAQDPELGRGVVRRYKHHDKPVERGDEGLVSTVFGGGRGKERRSKKKKKQLKVKKAGDQKENQQAAANEDDSGDEAEIAKMKARPGESSNAFLKRVQAAVKRFDQAQAAKKDTHVKRYRKQRDAEKKMAVKSKKREKRLDQAEKQLFGKEKIGFDDIAHRPPDLQFVQNTKNRNFKFAEGKSSMKEEMQSYAKRVQKSKGLR